jgi:S-adenosylmethionine:tRNA ribosyltransferase-isomerase
MRVDFFDYELPAHLIAQEPCPQRDQARLMLISRADATIAHHIFSELPDLLSPGDLLVLNDTRVLPARLLGRRARTRGKWEGLFLRGFPDGLWELLCQTRGRLTAGELIEVEPGALQLRLVRQSADGHWLAQPTKDDSPVDLLGVHGHVPLPLYIRKGKAREEDQERYQTVFARQAGAVAAPAAGLHFTSRLFERLKQRGIAWTFLTLHVGLGTFQPIQVEDLRQHRMHREWGELATGSVEALAHCRQRGGRVVAVGTTVVRVLETIAASGPVRPWSGETELYIYPPYEFRAVDALITNFHLPRSTLLLLVSAFAGVDLLQRAYRTAIEHEYRFFSYGAAMLIV